MRCSIGLLRCSMVVTILVAAGGARAEEGRFDPQDFRPFAAPQDLVMVSQSRPLSHLSASAGAYLSFSLDPLKLLRSDTSQIINVVTNRLQLDVMGSVGLFDWVEVAAVLPVVAFQSSDNLRDLGSEGSISSQALGDLRLLAKVPFPGLRRAAEARGFGSAFLLQVTLPTGSVSDFTSDGTVSAQPTLVFDYRTSFGMLVSLNAGVWLRPARELSQYQVGSSVQTALGLEVPVVRRWGITVVGNLWGNIRFDPPPEKLEDCGLGGLAGIRWYSSSGFTLTFGGGGGCSATLRMFASLVWVPAKTREYAALERFKDPPKPKPPDPDPDKDGLIGDKDRCPKEPGPPENRGCADTDADKDGIVDRLDKCPNDPARKGSDGCPAVSIKGNKLVIVEQVHFATDQDVILPESFPILEEVAGMIKAHPEIERVVVEGHTDVRASDAYNLDLSRRRAGAVARFLVAQGLAEERVGFVGYGRTRPIADNTTEAGMAMNRRVEFTIEKMRARTDQEFGPELPPEQRLPEGVLPQRQNILPDSGVLPGQSGSGLPSKSTLPKKGGVLREGSTLKGKGSMLPEGKGSTLPRGKGSSLPMRKGPQRRH